MTHGIVIRNPDTGSVVLDSNTQLGRILGVISITSPATGSLNVPGFAEGKAFHFPLMEGFGINVYPIIRVSGTTISYNFVLPPGSDPIRANIVYGVY